MVKKPVEPSLAEKTLAADTSDRLSSGPEATASEKEQPAWKRVTKRCGDGVVTYRLHSWSNFFEFLDLVVFSSGTRKRQYVWRGQRCDNWSLSTSLDRLFSTMGVLNEPVDRLERRALKHLEAFKYAARGRRGVSPAKLSTDEWWALGQHYGLATPLLDWSRSPFAAAYFAFEEATPGTKYRVVYGLDQNAVRQKSAQIIAETSYETGRTPVVEFFDPLIDENARLVSQGGLFTRSPIGLPIEQWVANSFEGSAGRTLLRIEIPSANRTGCLRTLNRMNINHLTLFPDLGGASRFTNFDTEFGVTE